MKKYTSLSLLIIIFLASCKSAPKKEEGPQGYVTAIGVAPIYNNEMGRAKDDALLDAKRNAVRKAMGDIIDARSEAIDGVLVESKIINKTQGFIEDYRILSAAPVSRHEYHVKIAAKVNSAILRETIEDVLRNLERPRIMVLCTESAAYEYKGEAQKQTGGFCTAALEKIFVSRGFELVDRGQTEKLLAKQKRALKKAYGGNVSALSKAAVDTGAEVILLAESNIENAGTIRNSRLNSMQSVLNVKAIETGTARILASAENRAAYPHIDPKVGARYAVNKSAKKVTDELIPAIMKKWDPNKAQTISVLVTGLDYGGIKDFRNELLEKIRGVKEVNRKGSVGSAAKLEVQFVGTSFELTDRLMDANLPYRIKAESVQPGNITLTVKPK